MAELFRLVKYYNLPRIYCLLMTFFFPSRSLNDAHFGRRYATEELMRSLFPNASELKLSLLYPVLKLAAVDRSQQASDVQNPAIDMPMLAKCGENETNKDYRVLICITSPQT